MQTTDNSTNDYNTFLKMFGGDDTDTHLEEEVEEDEGFDAPAFDQEEDEDDEKDYAGKESEFEEWRKLNDPDYEGEEDVDEDDDEEDTDEESDEEEVELDEIDDSIEIMVNGNVHDGAYIKEMMNREEEILTESEKVREKIEALETKADYLDTALAEFGVNVLLSEEDYHQQKNAKVMEIQDNIRRLGMGHPLTIKSKADLSDIDAAFYADRNKLSQVERAQEMKEQIVNERVATKSEHLRKVMPSHYRKNHGSTMPEGYLKDVVQKSADLGISGEVLETMLTPEGIDLLAELVSNRDKAAARKEHAMNTAQKARKVYKRTPRKVQAPKPKTTGNYRSENEEFEHFKQFL